MSIYNNWGLEHYDILNLFSGELDDFATPDKKNGKQNILDEMDIQAGKIKMKLPSNVLRLFDFVEYARMDKEKSYESGSGTTFLFPFPVNVNGTFSAYYTDKEPECGFTTTNNTVASSRCVTDNCSNLNICNVGTEITIQSVSIDSSGNYYGLTSDVDVTDKHLFVSFEIDNTSQYFQIAELKAMLRDMVACMLGSKLLMENENQWRLLDIVCATKPEFDKKWVPAEYRALKYWRQPWVSGFTSGKFFRSS